MVIVKHLIPKYINYSSSFCLQLLQSHELILIKVAFCAVHTLLTESVKHSIATCCEYVWAALQHLHSEEPSIKLLFMTSLLDCLDKQMPTHSSRSILSTDLQFCTFIKSAASLFRLQPFFISTQGSRKKF